MFATSDVSHLSVDEVFSRMWKAAPQRGHHTNQEIALPHLSSTQPVVCGPTRARRSRGQTEEREAIDQVLNIKSVVSTRKAAPHGRTTVASPRVLPVPNAAYNLPARLGKRGFTRRRRYIARTGFSFHGSAAAA